MKPLAIDLFCGLGGWTEGLLAEGYRVVGYDIEAHEYGDERYPAELVLADVLDLHGAQFADATLIVASPPCQEYSYMAMPWSRAKAKAAAIRADETGAELARLNQLFHASFRIQREAIEAAGRHIPLVVENVRGAIPWVGRSRWNYGSFHLWGDVPALMPVTLRATKVPGFRFDGSGGSFQTAAVEETGVKVPGLNWSDRSRKGQAFNTINRTREIEGMKNNGGSWFAVGPRGEVGERQSPARGAWINEGCKQQAGGDGYERNHPAAFGWKAPNTSSKGKARKAASARIAKIPLTLSRWIAAHYLPVEMAA